MYHHSSVYVRGGGGGGGGGGGVDEGEGQHHCGVDTTEESNYYSLGVGTKWRFEHVCMWGWGGGIKTSNGSEFPLSPVHPYPS